MVKYPLVLVNPRAARVSSDPDLVARIRQKVPADALFLSRSAEDLYPTLREARENGVETLLVVGGDGTLAGVLTALLRVWPHAALPTLVLAGGGARSSLARALGTRGTVEGVLARLLEAGPRLDTLRQPLLRIRPHSSESRYGLSLLGGAPARWLAGIESGPGRGLAGRTFESLRALSSLLVRGERARQLAEAIPAEVEIDGKRLDVESFTALGVSAIRELGLALSPFPADPLEGGAFRVGITNAGPARLSLEVPLLSFGLSGSSCLDLREASFLSLRFKEPTALHLDTEPLPASEMLTVEPGPVIQIARP